MDTSPIPVPSSHPILLRRFIVGLFALALLTSLWALTRGWSASLRDGHEFRQHQTALTAFYFKKDGLRLDYETPVLGPPWSIPLEFPFYQAVVAKLSNTSGLPLDQAGRLTSIFFFYATLPAIWLLLRGRLADFFDRLLAITPVLLCPVLMFYSRTFMIESTALCLSAWFLATFEMTLDRRRTGNLLATWLLGSLAIITKVTTFAGCWILLLTLVIERFLARRREGRNWIHSTTLTLESVLVALCIPVIAGAAWVVYSDHLKEIHPYARVLTSSALRPFTFGTLAQRLTSEWWVSIGHITFKQVLGWPASIILFTGLWLVAAQYRRLALLSAVCYTGGFLVFANLYYVHDYYFYASVVFLLVAFGIVSAGLLRSRWFHWSVALVIVSTGLAGEVQAFYQTYYSFYRRPNEAIPFEAEIIRRLTPVENVFAGFGYDWNGLLPYYSQRRAIMPFLGNAKDFSLLDRSIAQLGQRQVDTVIVTSYFRTEYPFIGILKDKLHLTPEPIIRTSDADIYVRRDRATAASKILAARTDWGGAQLNPQKDPPPQAPIYSYDLNDPKWAGRFPMTSPAPFLCKSPVEIGLMTLDDKPIIGTQAPTEIYFQPPPGSRSINAIGGMVPSSYTEGHTTPGVVLSVYEEFPDGSRHVIFARLLTPLTKVDDRGDVVISYQQEKPFTGKLVFAHLAIPSGNVSYSWSYWKNIVIR